MKKLLAGILATMMILMVGCEITVNHKEDPSKAYTIKQPDGTLLIVDFDILTYKSFMAETTEVKDYHIVIHSLGGNATNMLGMINRIENLQAQGAFITTETYSVAMSAGANVFLLGDQRIAHSGSIFMLHAVGSSDRFGNRKTTKTIMKEYLKRAPTNPSTDLLQTIDYYEMMDDNIRELLWKKTHMSDKDIEHWMHHENYNFMSAEEALELRVATEIRN
jgi:ATP-dependent protease ClpP protease subunit